MQRLVMGSAAALIVLTGAAAEDAAAVVCGQKVAGAGSPAIGALTLREKPSTLIHPFGNETDTQNLALLFKVNGCTLPTRSAPSVRPLPDDDAPASFDTDIDDKQIMLERVSDDRLNVVIPVDPEDFKPGSYGAIIQVSAGYLTPSLTPVTVSRTESSLWWPAGLGALGGLVGLVLTVLTKVAAGSTMRTDGWRWSAVTIVAVGAGVVAGLLAYDDQDIWRLSQNWDATSAAGLTAATTGSALAVLGVVLYDTVRARRPPGRRRGRGEGLERPKRRPRRPRKPT